MSAAVEYLQHSILLFGASVDSFASLFLMLFGWVEVSEMVDFAETAEFESQGCPSSLTNPNISVGAVEMLVYSGSHKGAETGHSTGARFVEENSQSYHYSHLEAGMAEETVGTVLEAEKAGTVELDFEKGLKTVMVH